MSVPERRAMVERPGENLSVRRQCALLNLARSGVYRPGPVTGARDLSQASSSAIGYGIACPTFKISSTPAFDGQGYRFGAVNEVPDRDSLVRLMRLRWVAWSEIDRTGSAQPPRQAAISVGPHGRQAR